jgi:isopenicillin-N epimerase
MGATRWLDEREVLSMSANPIWGDDWDEVKSLWLLDPKVAHCNHGSFGAVPESVLAVQEAFRARMAANPMRWFSREMPELVVEARADVAQFVGAEPADVAFVTNVSAGVSAVMASLALDPGDEIISTSHIYGAVSLAVDRLCTRTGAARVVVDVPLDADDEEIVARIASACTTRTALVVIDQITSPTARLFPVEAITAAVHVFGAAVLVDGAHAVGMLPVDVPAIGADFWTANLHKWPCAPAGTGVLWVAPAWHDRIFPTVVSHAEPEGFPASFDRVGTNDLSAWLASPYALGLLGALGWDRVRTHNEALVAWGQTTIAEALHVPTETLRHDPGLSLALVPLPRGLADTRSQAQALQAHMVTLGVEMVIPSWDGRSNIRLSAHVYNQPSDYERIAIGIRDTLAS